MDAKLPPPDPNESLGLQPVHEAALSAPMTIFALGRPSPQADRLSAAVLDLRPGLLVVLDDA
jgi:hypothetical protein